MTTQTRTPTEDLREFLMMLRRAESSGRNLANQGYKYHSIPELRSA